ncbi:hypothetical protein [Aureimonas sp. AU12]|jgi:hypothetical protein|uniref:hypothetical protein n=1 Tax=Aureimonas sp. AU12 TaxID=1638161 RepID=UPI000784D34B|nr:hypothetical protein [Aureimonas sp. AU12]
MTPETHVYFPRTGAESTRFILVRLFEKSGEAKAEASIAGPVGDGEDVREAPVEGDPQSVLRDARERAGLTGLDLRIELDGVEWNGDLGSLVDPQ